MNYIQGVMFQTFPLIWEPSAAPAPLVPDYIFYAHDRYTTHYSTVKVLAFDAFARNESFVASGKTTEKPAKSQVTTFYSLARTIREIKQS